jgi:uncharacterized damage-inducible protein DinB
MNTLMNHRLLLEYWQSHRRITRRTIELFPDDQLFSFQPAPPMRSFGDLMLEVLKMFKPNLRGWVTGEWTKDASYNDVNTKDALLKAWDESGDSLNQHWAHISENRLFELEPFYFYGNPSKSHSDSVLYLIDNEIHHRAQGFVYLRMLGLEPPFFWDHASSQNESA